MSIYIPGMDMPTKEKDEVITIYPDGTVLKYSLYSDFYNAKSRAIEVPPHGALKDGDALWDRAFDVWGTDADEHDTNLFLSMINDAETIIPADSEEST